MGDPLSPDDDYPVLDFDPASISNDLTHAIGAVSVAYSQLEYVIHVGICCLLGVSEETGLAVTTHLPMPAKLQMFDTLLDMSDLPIEQARVLAKARSAASDATARRNSIIHDSWAKRADGVELRVSTKARGRLVLEGKPIDLGAIRRDAEFIRTASLELMGDLRAFGLTKRSS